MSSVLDSEDVSYVSSPYLPGSLILNATRPVTSNAHRYDYLIVVTMTVTVLVMEVMLLVLVMAMVVSSLAAWWG